MSTTSPLVASGSWFKSQSRILFLSGSCTYHSQKRRLSCQIAALSILPALEMSSYATALKSVDYEIFGEVQGVFFRKVRMMKSKESISYLSKLDLPGYSVSNYTEEQARKLGLVGWVKNTARGTVTGQVQGSVENVNFMMNWLKSVGSPMSRIDKAQFSDEREISKLDFNNFSTRY
ncbi:acylphosphatase-2-like isoform X2 [Chiloscyllium plagiosum]|uniref:acylphosphatase-2-like isoform X2 n=1 Tax=Chiloscyllium plagiosum TaxID=36176 RepID=UPI001CB8520B|nr:acylphosphatase-2-like isoform X2 [Chiloscyllium plagiosum]